MACVAGGLTFGAWFFLHGQSATRYRTAPLQRGDIDFTVSATGSPNAVVTVQVGSQVSGNVKELFADFNTKVTKGQVVARIDPEIFQARVNQAAANLEAARAAVVNARAVVEKDQAGVASATAASADAKANIAKAEVAVNDAQVKLQPRLDLFQQGVLSREDRDTAQATYSASLASRESAQAQQQAADANIGAAQAELEVGRTELESAAAQVKQSEAALEQAKLDLEHTYIRAPVDGTVVSRNVDVGQTVAASLQAPTLFLIAQDLTKMQVDTNISEADIGRIHVGQPASFTVDAFPGEVFHGKVVSIRKAPINVQNVITYDAVVEVPNPDLKLFPGMTATVKILVDQRRNVLKVANAALRFQPSQAASPSGSVPSHVHRKDAATPRVQLWVLGDDGKPRAVEVVTGLSDGNFTEIVSGDLKAGDSVIVDELAPAETATASPFAPAPRRGRGPGF
jgi:HlyD family secretion protein